MSSLLGQNDSAIYEQYTKQQNNNLGFRVQMFLHARLALDLRVIAPENIRSLRADLGRAFGYKNNNTQEREIQNCIYHI